MEATNEDDVTSLDRNNTELFPQSTYEDDNNSLIAGEPVPYDDYEDEQQERDREQMALRLEKSEVVGNRGLLKSINHKEDTGLAEQHDKGKTRKLEDAGKNGLRSRFVLHSTTDHWPLPKRDKTFQHDENEEETQNKKTIKSYLPKKTWTENLNRSTLNLSGNQIQLKGITNPRDALNKKNEEKNAFIVDSMLSGFPDLLCLTSCFFKDEYGIKKGPVMLPLLSLYLSDISPNENLRNRIYRVHLEYGIGDKVLRWDLDKTTKEFYDLHKKLTRKNTKQHLDPNLRKKDAVIPKFPPLPSHNMHKLRQIFNNKERHQRKSLNTSQHINRDSMLLSQLPLEGSQNKNNSQSINGTASLKDSLQMSHFIGSSSAKGSSIKEPSKSIKGSSIKEPNRRVGGSSIKEPPPRSANGSGMKESIRSIQGSSIKDLSQSIKGSSIKGSSIKGSSIKGSSIKDLPQSIKGSSIKDPPQSIKGSFKEQQQQDSVKESAIGDLGFKASAPTFQPHTDSNSLPFGHNDEPNLNTVIPMPQISRAPSGHGSVSSGDSGSVLESLHTVVNVITRMSTLGGLIHKKDNDDINSNSNAENALEILKFKVNEEHRKSLQKYFDILMKNVMFKEQANRLFQFFELSPLSVLLSNEIERKRKEGYLFVMSSASKQGWRVSHFKLNDIQEMIRRHTSKWCVLGCSFILYTSDISATTPEDVFLVDSKFKITLQGISDSEKSIPHHDFTSLSPTAFDDEEYDSESDDQHSRSKSKKKYREYEDGTLENATETISKKSSYATIKLENSERKLTLVAKLPRQTKKWAMDIKKMMSETEWAKQHRFNSFAPVRSDCFAQWFVDARDYMWAASSAMEMAEDVIYIHDWWLSPELYMRRPANGNQEFRIDRILKRKAEQGVKIFVIVYRNVGNTVVTDSMYTKHSLLDLHPNIFVLRSPNQIMQNVFFWAHHEKLLIIDHSVCFLGGIDLCFGRYDTPDHVLVDDAKYAFGSQVNSIGNNENIEDFQVFPGKDYSNPRKKDFYELTEPFQDMYDRQIVPRMPWHDVHMVTCGQIARDLSRHFVQRWNYLLRQKRPSRPTPILVPPREFTKEELKGLKMTGSCEIQLLRSSGNWSLGLFEHEQSIHDAYIKCIESSEHFVYMENQFFVTSCEVDGVFVKNSIGDALVDRIITAHTNRETWKAVIVIPLMPGFEADVDTKEGGSVRLIMQCQYMSISMGDTSIFAKLRRVGIRPEEYIQFYSLRKWGMIGKNKLLTTEQLYIHAKTMIVDDRIAIIGSANINERSMRGTRDSEVCAIVRDKDMVNSMMDGRPYKAGRFSHTLRVRLMREHMGVDIDLLDLVERRFAEIERFCKSSRGSEASVLRNCSLELSSMVELGTRYLLNEWEGTPEFKKRNNTDLGGGYELMKELVDSFTQVKNAASEGGCLDDIVFSCSFNHRAGAENIGIRDNKTLSSDARVSNAAHRKEVKGDGLDKYNSMHFVEAKLKMIQFMKDCVENTLLADKDKESCRDDISPLPDFEDVIEVLSQRAVEDGDNDELNRSRWTMIKRLYYLRKLYSKALNESRENSYSPEDSMPNEGTTGTSTKFSPDLNSIKKVKTPDIPVTTLSNEEIHDIDQNSLPKIDYGFIDPYGFEDPLDIEFFEGMWMPQAIRNTLIYQMVFHAQPDDMVQTWKDYKSFEELKNAFMEHQNILRGCNDSLSSPSNVDPLKPSPEELESCTTSNTDSGDKNGSYFNKEKLYEESQSRENMRNMMRRAKVAELDRFQRGSNVVPMDGRTTGYGAGVVYDYDTGMKLLKLVRGNLVQFPTRWLKKEVEGSNWFYKADKIPPIQIYN